MSTSSLPSIDASDALSLSACGVSDMSCEEMYETEGGAIILIFGPGALKAVVTLATVAYAAYTLSK